MFPVFKKVTRDCDVSEGANTHVQTTGKLMWNKYIDRFCRNTYVDK